MAPRRGQPPSSLSPHDSLTPNGPPSPAATRSTSPSSGFTQFLTKPSKWFSRSVSASKVPSSTAEGRSSTSSGPRKPKISRPTDPRPILDAYADGASRSVLDLSARPPGSIDIPRINTPSTPSSPNFSSNSGGLGDLRNISRKGWSRSADDLSRISPVPFSPIKTAFKERVAEYRSRSDSVASAVSTNSPTSPASMINGRHPFPSAATTSPSSSPPKLITPRSATSRSSTLPSLSISVSTPTLEENHATTNLTPTHFHTRSHSFTPKMPSKLATPTYAASPTQSSSLSSPEAEKHTQPPPRTGYGFGLGGKNNSKAVIDQPAVCGSTTSPTLVNNRATTLLSPPIIVEPETEVQGGNNRKRSSQIVFHSGFINRFTDLPSNLHHGNLSLAKGWKPFKLELKGSKLYFYKPPSDRAAAIKELFPSGLVPPSQEDADESDSDVGAVGNSEGSSGRVRKGNGRDEGGTLGRKKRAYWGRRTHPDLIQDEKGNIVKGTFEALVHECVFGTTFFKGGEEAEETQQSDDWKEFASTSLFGLPPLVGGPIYEAEFLRCCSYLISGAEDEAREKQKDRVGWLANEYLRHHGKPNDAVAWSEWRQETIPGIDLSADVVNTMSGMPGSASTQAIYPSSPLIESVNSGLDTFSPRPENAPRMLSLLDTLGSYIPSNRHLDYEQQYPGRPGYASPNTRIPWAALNQDGLSRDILLQLDPHFLARSLTLFHRFILDQAPADLTAGFLLGSDSFNTDDDHECETTSAPLFGSNDHPHWLTKLLLVQIFGGDTSGPSSVNPPGRRSEDRTAHTSRTHSRSEIISIWARIGELCRRAGDECSWRAICSALCSRPVARLDKAWRRVDPQALAAIGSWVSSEDGIPSVNDPQLTPWGGDIKLRLSEVLSKAKGENSDQIFQVQVLHVARKIFERFRTTYSLCPRNIFISEDEIDDDLRRMVVYWREVADGSRTTGLAVKFQRVEQFMSLSLAAESRRKGLFEPYFWSRPSSTQPLHAVLIPLSFPEPLLTLTLVDRTHLVRSRIDSDAMEIQQYLRGTDNRFANHTLQRFDLNQDFTKRLILGQGGTVISVYDGDLLLLVQSGGSDSVPDSRPSSRAPSRPPSSVVDSGTTEKNLGHVPSIRVKPSTSLNRKTSVARRSSLPSVSHRQNYVITETSSEPPLRVVVQAGTLDALVNILVHGLDNISVSVADDNGEMTLREGMTRELIVDRSEFARVWWSVFRSFVTPFVFFELLRKLYITSQPAGSLPSVTEYIYMSNRRNEVLATMKEWLTIGGGAQDVLDDAQLFTSVESFLGSSSDHMVHKAEAFEDTTVQQAWKVTHETLRTLKSCFTAQTMRPTISRGIHNQRHHDAVNGARTRHVAPRDPPDLDRMDPEELVDNLDGMACAAFSNVTEEDLYIAADLLEVQTFDKTGWFSSREAPMTEELVEIQSMYSHIQEVAPSSLISELSQDALYRLLPPGIRSCIRAFGIIRKWLISKIVAPRLGPRTRQARMEILIQAIEVARLRNAENPSSGPILIQPCVRSFVEAVVTSALISVESRMHHRSWQSIANNRGCQCDSLASLLLRPFVNSTSSRDCLTVDIGWLLERMVEVIASPDVLDSSSQEGQTLVNFDKRRHLCNLITKAWSIPSTRKHPPSDEVNRRGFERLNNIEKEVFHLHFDHRGIKEEATREAMHAGANSPSHKKIVRPFHKIVAIQNEKNRRDKNLRSRLQREKVLEQSRNERRDDFLNKAMRPRKPVQTPQKQNRNKKSMSAFLNFMRPISSAFGAELLQPNAFKKTAAELDFAASGKPSLVISVLDAQIAQLINNERSYTFKVDTEDGGHYLFQAMTKRDMTKWLDTISRVTQSAARRRLTYLGSSPKPQIADHIHDRPIVASRDPLAVFGVELEFLLQREAFGGDIPSGTVPNIIHECLDEVESRGLTEVGIYRIAGATLEINALKDAYNHGKSPVTSSTDIHAVCDLVKSWFRVLPEPVFPAASYYEVMEAMRLENLDERLSNIRSVVQSLPQANFDLLKRVAEHLDKVTDYEEHNHMTAEALAIVFSPNLLRAPQNDFVMILNNMGLSHKLVKALITHFHVIFDEADPEAEVHSEDEYDPPIPEEEEEDEELDDGRQLEPLEQNQPSNYGILYTHG